MPKIPHQRTKDVNPKQMEFFPLCLVDARKVWTAEETGGYGNDQIQTQGQQSLLSRDVGGAMV